MPGVMYEGMKRGCSGRLCPTERWDCHRSGPKKQINNKKVYRPFPLNRVAKYTLAMNLPFDSYFTLINVTVVIF